MIRFALAIEYLMGYAVATDHTNREKVEWPPHPARVFMALAAAHFETDAGPQERQAERAALEWLEALGEPALALPEQALPENVSVRSPLTVYVPVNDATGVDVLPERRSRQPRMFPRVYVGDQPIRLIWSVENDCNGLLHGLERLCRKVTRIGHSSSLVWVRLEREVESGSITHEPSQDSLSLRLRTTGDGALARLESAFNAGQVQGYRELTERAKGATRRARKALRQQRSERFPLGAPVWQRPAFSITRGYRPVQPARIDAIHSPFDPTLIVLKESDDNPRNFGLESTLLITHALRATLQRESHVQPVPDWVSGHAGPNGPKLSDGSGHMALVPLPFVGPEHADGHLLGVAIVLPRDVPARQRSAVLASILFHETTHEPKMIDLKMGRAGVFQIVRETSLSTKVNLQSQTWTQAAGQWASVTPIVLDRMPKSDRVKDRRAWNDQVKAIITRSCINQKLPAPIAVRVEKAPFFVGSLGAMPGQGGFPLLRPGTFQVHAQIDFGVQVQGPLLLGAGRFRGYGLCRPWRGESR